VSRSGYTEDCNHLELYRGAVLRAIRGKRGQRLLLEMGRALDAMPVKELVAETIVAEGQVCALGSVAVARGMDVAELDVHDGEAVGKAFGIAESLAREIAYENDEGSYRCETPAERWKRMRAWGNAHLLPVDPPPPDP
jgi:hypothetical protein